MLRTSHLRHFALLFGSSLAFTLALFGGLGNWSIAQGAEPLCVEPTGAGSCYTTIAGAVTAAANGETIQIHAGTYYENVDAGSKSLTFQGDGRSATIVDGGNNARVFQVSSGFNLTLYDLTVRNGNAGIGSGGGIYLGGSANLLTLVNVDVLSSTAGAKGGGAYSYGSATISNTNFISNTAGITSAGSGAGLFTQATLTVTSGRFERNVSYGGSGGGLAQNGSLYSATITGTHFYSNTAGNGNGGGASITGATGVVENAFFQGNQATGIGIGGAVYAPSGTGASLEAMNVDAFNNMAVNGGAIYAGRDATISGGRYMNNMGDGVSGHGGALCANKAMTVTDAQIIGNYAALGGGIMQWTGGLKVVNTLLARNTASDKGPALYLANSSGVPAQIVNSTIATPTVSPGVAIYSSSGTFYVTNTLISGYATGIQRAGAGSPEEDYNLFAQLTTETAGIITRGGHSRATSSARFVDPLNDDYHLLDGSGAAARGIDAGVTVDMDGNSRPNPPSIGAYEGTAQQGEYTFTNTADVTSEVPYKGVVTYTLVISNNTALIDSRFRVTDVLPAGVTFKQWLTKPSYASNVGSTVTYSGPITDSTVLTLGFLVTNTASGGAVITNTAVFTGTDAAGSATAVFGATTTECVASQTNGWTVAFASCILPDVKKVIPAGITVILDRSDLTLTGDLEMQTGGAISPGSKTFALTGSRAQTLTGDLLTFTGLVLDKTNQTDRVTIAGKLKVTKKLTISKGSLVSASEYGDLEIQDAGVLTLTNPISITGSFTNSGHLYTQGFAVNFTGGLVQPAVQNLVLNVTTWFDDLNVLTGTTLVEAVTDDNALLNGALTNYGTIRKTQPIAAATTYYFGLAGKYAGSDLEVDATVPGTLTSLQVDRIDAVPANPPTGKTTPIYWTLTPVGSGYTVNLTLPHDGVSTPSACRRVSGSTWDCAQSASDASTVTRNGVTQFSDWAVFSVQQSVATTTTVTSHPSTTVFGEPVVFTATLEPLTVGGTVQFYAGGSVMGSAQQIENGVAALTTSALAAGSYAISATSTITTPGYLDSTGTLTGLQVVNKADTVVVVTMGNNPTVFGETARFTATVVADAPGGGLPTGTVVFSVNNQKAFTATLDANGEAAYATSALDVGDSDITVKYGGDANFNAATGGPETQTNDNADTSVGVASSMNPSSVGQLVVLTATVVVSAPGGGLPSGVVAFTISDSGRYTATLDAEGVATYSTSSLSGGTHTVQAAYSGDGHFNSSIGLLNGGQVVTRRSVNIVMASAPNPSILGAQATFTATVSAAPPGVGTPTGVVTFTADGIALGTAPLDGNGAAAYATATLVGGTHAITSTYGGDNSFNSGTGTLQGGQVVNRAASTAAVAVSANPATYGESLILTATVGAVGTEYFTPTGVVTFDIGASQRLTTVVNAGKQAVVTTTAPIAGTYGVTTTYYGDSSYLGSTGTLPSPLVVNKADSTTTVTSSANPALFGQSITFTATVSLAAPGMVVSGTLVFKLDGTPVYTGTLADGRLAYTTAALAVGSHTVAAEYAGTADLNGSIGSLSGNQRVTGSTLAVLFGAVNPSVYGQAVTFTATVTTTVPGGGTPEGEVAFSADGDAIDDCEAVELSGAVATCTTDLLAAGTHTVTAEYAGSTNYLGSTAPAYYQVVQPLPVAVNDAGGTLQETPVTLTVLANDLDPAGGGLLISAITLQPVHGALQVAPDAKTVLYTPESGYAGQDSFLYVAIDTNGNSDDALVTIMVTAKNQTAEPPQIEPVDPQVDASKEFTSPAASVEVQLPANFYTDTLSEKEILFLSYTPVVTATEETHTPPGNLKFGNFEFDLTLFRNNEPQHGVLFEAPLTVTIAYDPALLNGLREDLLDVYFWNGTAWSKDGVTVVGRDPVNHTVTFLLAHLSHFGFFSNAPTASDPAPEPDGARHLYLPGLMCQQQIAAAAAEMPTPEPPAEPPAAVDAAPQKLYLPALNR